MQASVTDEMVPTVERRVLDRRTNLWRSFVGQFYRARRSVDRRRNRDDAGYYYVDRHEPWLVAVVSLTLLLCIADIVNTLVLIMHGANEVNPFMALLINKDVWLFVYVKFGLTAICLIVLLMHKNYRFLGRFSGYQLLFASLTIYVILIIYQIKLLTLVPGPLLATMAWLS